MKYYHCLSVESVVLFDRNPQGSLRREIAERILWVLNCTHGLDHWSVGCIEKFVFDGDPDAFRLLQQRLLTPSQQELVVTVRRWYKAIWKDTLYHDKSLWTRQRDAVVCNLNDGRTLAFIDAHHWVN